MASITLCKKYRPRSATQPVQAVLGRYFLRIGQFPKCQRPFYLLIQSTSRQNGLYESMITVTTYPVPCFIEIQEAHYLPESGTLFCVPPPPLHTHRLRFYLSVVTIFCVPPQAVFMTAKQYSMTPTQRVLVQNAFVQPQVKTTSSSTGTSGGGYKPLKLQWLFLE